MSRRTEKLARLIRESVSTTVLFEIRDPRVQNVTVLGAEVAGDMRSAKVRVSVMGDERDEQLALHGLESARGFLQAKLNDRVDLRYTPILSFEIDHGVKQSLEASRVLREIEEREGPINPDRAAVGPDGEIAASGGPAADDADPAHADPAHAAADEPGGGVGGGAPEAGDARADDAATGPPSGPA